MLAILLTAIVAASTGYWKFNRAIKNLIENLYSEANTQDVIVTEAMIKNLPKPVRKYLTYTGVVGKQVPKTVYLKQVGKIRQNPEASWMNFEATEYYSVNPPKFIWKASLPSSRLPLVLGLDKFADGQGNMTIKMLSLFSIVDAKGKEINQGAMMRYLNEMMWFPAAFLGNNISWKEIDDTSAEVTLTDKGKTASAILYFDGEGKLINFVAKRYMTSGKNYQLETWATPIAEYGEFEGLKLPVKGSAVWNLDGRDYKYIDISVSEIEYN